MALGPLLWKTVGLEPRALEMREKKHVMLVVVVDMDKVLWLRPHPRCG
jgi:hypothetical protein